MTPLTATGKSKNASLKQAGIFNLWFNHPFVCSGIVLRVGRPPKTRLGTRFAKMDSASKLTRHLAT